MKKSLITSGLGLTPVPRVITGSSPKLELYLCEKKHHCIIIESDREPHYGKTNLILILSS